MAEVALQFNEVFQPVNECRRRYRILKGSAGSGKSTDVAQDFVLKLMDPAYKGANLLVVRKIEETNRDSTFVELQAAIKRACTTADGHDLTPIYWKINLSPLRLECKTTGCSIIFRGMKDSRQREKLKSITFARGKLTWIWVEEATELDEGDIEILDDRLRGILVNPNLYYQITMTFNPVHRLHWIKRKYFDAGADPDVLTHHSTYLDNAFIDAAYHRRMQRRKREDPDGYMIYGLGEWGETGGLILTKWEVLDFDLSPDLFDKRIYSQDFGFNHANAILDIGFKDVTTTAGNLFICDEIYEFEKHTGELISIANKRGLDKKRPMYCDSAEPDRIKEWKQEGYKARAVHKASGSVKAQIDILKRLNIIIHPRCVNTIKEVQQWKWKKDSATGLYLDEPVEFMDDAMACARYSTEAIARGPGTKAGHANY